MAPRDFASFRSVLKPASGFQSVQFREVEFLSGVKDARVLKGIRLTDSERKVLALVAEGLTNRQIATRTHLSEKTVKNYVSDVLAKLNLTSRTQAAVFAVEHHLGPKH